MQSVFDVLLHSQPSAGSGRAHQRNEENLSPRPSPVSNFCCPHNETASTSNMTGSDGSASEMPVDNFYHLHELPHTLPTVIILSCFVTVVILCTLIGNTLVCLAVALVRKLRKQAANYLLVSLAVADLCVGFMVMPLAFLYLILGRWPFGQFLCDVWTYSDVTLCTASILNLCVVSVDRYLAITRPLEYGPKRTSGRMIIYIVIVWLAAVLVSFLPPIAFLSSSSKEGHCEINQHAAYQIYATMCAFYIPATIIMVVNYKIYKAARRLTLADRRATAYTGCTATSTMVAAAAVFVAATPVVRDNKRRSTSTNGGRFSLQNIFRRPTLFGYKNRCERISEDDPKPDHRADEVDCAVTANRTPPLANRSIADTLTRRRSRSRLFPFTFSFRSRLKSAERQSISKHLTEAFINRSIGDHPPMDNNWERLRGRSRRHMSAPAAHGVRSRGSACRNILHARLRQQTGSQLKHHHSQAGAETKAMKTLGLIMGCFIACWLPFFVVALLKALCRNRCGIPNWVDSVVLWLGYANSTLNPLLYAKYNKDFRIPFREMLCCRFRTLKSVLRMEEYMDTFGSVHSSLDGAVTIPNAPSSTCIAGNHPPACPAGDKPLENGRSGHASGSISSPPESNGTLRCHGQQQPDTFL